MLHFGSLIVSLPTSAISRSRKHRGDNTQPHLEPITFHSHIALCSRKSSAPIMQPGSPSPTPPPYTSADQTHVPEVQRGARKWGPLCICWYPPGRNRKELYSVWVRRFRECFFWRLAGGCSSRVIVVHGVGPTRSQGAPVCGGYRSTVHTSCTTGAHRSRSMRGEQGAKGSYVSIRKANRVVESRSR